MLVIRRMENRLVLGEVKDVQVTMEIKERLVIRGIVDSLVIRGIVDSLVIRRYGRQSRYDEEDTIVDCDTVGNEECQLVDNITPRRRSVNNEDVITENQVLTQSTVEDDITAGQSVPEDILGRQSARDFFINDGGC